MSKYTRLAVYCHSDHLRDCSGGYFCMTLLTGPVMVGLIELKLVASCVKLCSNSSLAVGKTGLHILLTKVKYHEQAIKATCSRQGLSFIERPGGIRLAKTERAATFGFMKKQQNIHLG